MVAPVSIAKDAADAAGALGALARAEGSAAHPHSRSNHLAHGRSAARDIADIVHHLCLLHGRYPGVIDHAAQRTAPPLDRFLRDGAQAFADERALLARLVVAVGPLPSTPGQAQADAAVLAQRHAIDMLGQSDRTGCAAGAALALILDWAAIRPVIDEAARRLAIDPAGGGLPDPNILFDAVRAAEIGPATVRAMLFGAQQILAQHRGLWDLLQARALARADL